MDRNEFIKQSLDIGKTPEAISEKLAFAGYDPLSASEERDIAKGVYGKNLAQKTLKNVHDLGSGMATILGAGARFVTDPEFRKELGQATPSISASQIGEVLTENWNYNPATFAVDFSKGLRDVGAGLQTDPGLALLDLAPVVGAGVKGATKGVKTILPKLTKSTPNVSPTAKSLTGEIISTDKNINDILNISKDAPSTKITELGNAYKDLKNKFTNDEIAGAYKNLEEGTRVGGDKILEATEELNKFAREVDSVMKEVGVDPNKAEEVAKLQNMSRMIKADSGLNINIDELVKVAEGDKKTITKLDKMGLDRPMLGSYLTRAEDLYNQGLIFPVRHASNDIKGAKGLITIEDLRKGALAERRYGTQSYKELGKAFNEGGYEPLLRELERAKQTTGAFDEIAKGVGVKVDAANLPTLGKGEVYVSPKVLQEVVGTTIEQGGNLKSAIKDALKSFNDTIEGLPTDDIYIVRKKDLNALENAFASDSKLPNWMENIGSIGKQSALSTSNYIFGNAMANITSNLATGVTPLHYIKAIKDIDDIPSALKRSTSYQGYLGKEVDVNAKVKSVYKELVKDIASDKSTVMDKFRLSHSMANYPIFRTASNLESIDRGASYFKNAERLAKELGKDIKEVIEDAKVNGGNNPTFREIKRRIDNDLGDYIGHNYYLNPMIERTARTFIPFYRPYTQSGRVLWNIAQNYPGYYQTQIKLPSLLGDKVSEWGEGQGVIPSEEYKGAPVSAGFGRIPSRVMYNPYHNVTAIGEVAGGAFLGSPDLLPSVNTFAITPFLSLMGLNKYGVEAKLPNSYTVNGKQIVMDNNGNPIVQEPTITDRIRLSIAQTAQTYAPGVNTINKSILPILATVLKQDYRTPSDYSIFGQIGDTSIPLLSEGNKTARVNANEKILPTLGFKITATYKKNKNRLSLRDVKKVRQQQYFNKLRNERR